MPYRSAITQLFYLSLLCSTAINAAPQSDAVIVLSEDLRKYLYREHINCEDSSCIYTPSVQDSPLWISEENGNKLNKTDKGYHLKNTSLSIIYSIPITRTPGSSSETSFTFDLSDLRVDGLHRHSVRRRSTWVLPEGTEGSQFNSTPSSDNWLSLRNLVILETEEQPILQAKFNINNTESADLTALINTITEPQSGAPLLTTTHDLSVIDAPPQCSRIIDIITRPNCDSNSSLIFNGISFKQNSSSLSPNARRLLDKLVPSLINTKLGRFEIGAFTDSKGPHRWNLRLSSDRAQTIRQYFIFRGIKPNRLVAVGYGEDHPIAENNSAEGRRLNRRVEFKRLVSD